MTKTIILLILIALCSSCTFTHVALSDHTTTLVKSDHTPTPWYVPVVDASLIVGGFEAGPVTKDETANVAGLALTGLVFVSLAATIALWGHL